MSDYRPPTREENIAIIRICIELAHCDGPLNAGKIEALNRVLQFLSCGQSEVDEAQKLDSASAMLKCQKMSEDNKDVLILALNNVAKGDGPINEREKYCIESTKLMLNL